MNPILPMLVADEHRHKRRNEPTDPVRYRHDDGQDENERTAILFGDTLHKRQCRENDRQRPYQPYDDNRPNSHPEPGHWQQDQQPEDQAESRSDNE